MGLAHVLKSTAGSIIGIGSNSGPWRSVLEKTHTAVSTLGAYTPRDTLTDIINAEEVKRAIADCQSDMMNDDLYQPIC